MKPNNLLQALSSSPVQDVAMGNVSLLRLDKTGGPAPGNKSFKLATFFVEAKQQGVSRLVSFGGAWSNHLHALAALGCQHGIQTIGIVRGEEGERETAMLSDARGWGMQIVRMSRQEYRRRNDPQFQQQLAARYAPCLLIPEGGDSSAGARGCMAIAQLIREESPHARHIVIPVGTGTTLAGIAAGLDESYTLTGISALKGAGDLERRVQQHLSALQGDSCASWQVLHDFHCGGFARISPALMKFMLAFEELHGVPIEPVYTGKMLFAIHQLMKRGEWESSAPVLAIHSGGLQGRRGFSWLV